jgi:hypothetical protein
MERLHETARSSGRGACSSERCCQCPGWQRQGATAAARRDEGVTLRPGLYGKGRLDAAPLLFTFRFGLPIRRNRQPFGAQLRLLSDVRDSFDGWRDRDGGKRGTANTPLLPLEIR